MAIKGPVTEQQEREWLSEIIDMLNEAYLEVDRSIERAAKELKEQKAYMYENKAGMDAAEKASVKQSVNMQAISGEAAVAFKKRLLKLMEVPYFGRVDFRHEGSKIADPIYVGIHAYHDEERNENIIHDWRAPVSGMFYDFEPGKAGFDSPSGRQEGEIERKRQYRIREGELEMMLESDLYIRDDVLQKELSRSADDKMKNIVATIQRDQNAIIRDETTPVLIIQGVAGSGKTSIALHRIAFLLYRFKDTLTARDIMIISPNKVFSDYISNVLPELGEDSIPEMEMERLADYVLNGKFKFQTFFEQVNELLEKGDEAFINRMKFKSGPDFLQKLTSYVNWIKMERFEPGEMRIRYKSIPSSWLRAKWNQTAYMPLKKRGTALNAEILKKVKNEFGYDLKSDEKKGIKNAVLHMVGQTNLRILYKEFFEWLRQPEMFTYASGTKYEYADLFPLMYLKMQIEGFEAYKGVKHLIIDEMQDYSAVQYAVLARLFRCNKTVLGDANQNVNPYSSTTAADIAEMLNDAQAVTLRKSYRSTMEITEFSRIVNPAADAEAVERHGPEPELLSMETKKNEQKQILEQLRAFRESDRQTFGIICRTHKEAGSLYKYLSKQDDAGDIQLLAPDSSVLQAGVLISCAHLAKGLEFDEVYVPFVSDGNYSLPVDRSMLYIACTRAMHRLTLSHTGAPSRFVVMNKGTVCQGDSANSMSEN